MPQKKSHAAKRTVNDPDPVPAFRKLRSKQPPATSPPTDTTEPGRPNVPTKATPPSTRCRTRSTGADTLDDTNVTVTSPDPGNPTHTLRSACPAAGNAIDESRGPNRATGTTSRSTRYVDGPGP